MKKKIAIVTGTRAEYGLFKPVMHKIQKKMILQIIATGMHFFKEHGLTYKLIETDGFNINKKIQPTQNNDSNAGMAKNLGAYIKGITSSLEELESDIVLVLGDRSEALAGAISGAFLNKIVAHIHGGEVTKGCIDESIRHAITKFSHIHFPATYDSAMRIIRLGERPENVHIVGAPGIEMIRKGEYSSKEKLLTKYGISNYKPLILVVQHPVTQESEKAKSQIKITLNALKEFDAEYFIIYPNNDVGGKSIINEIKSTTFINNIHTHANIPRDDFLGLMSISSIMIGNSSSGIIEAPSFKLPVINVGIRQDGRLRASNVIDVPHDKEDILKAINKALFDKKFRVKMDNVENPYGDGRTSERIVNVLENLEISDDLLKKQITY